MKRLRKAGEYLIPNWVDIIALLVTANFYSALQLVTPYIVKVLLDDILPSGNIDFFNVLILLYFVVILLMVATSVLREYVYTKVSLSVAFAIRQKLFVHLQYLDLGFHSQKELGDILSRLMDDVSNIESLLSMIVNDFLTNFIYVALLLAVCITLSWEMTLVSLLLLPAIMIAQQKYGVMLKGKYERVRERDAEYFQYVQEKISLVELVKLFSREAFELHRHFKKATGLIKRTLDLSLAQSSSSASISILIMGSLLFVLWMGGTQVIQGIITIGTFIAIFTYISNMFDPLSVLTTLNLEIQMNLVSLKRVFAFLETKPAIKIRKNAKKIKKIKGEIEFRNISFAYDEKNKILDKMTFKIKPGETVAFVGKTGCGKSTILKMINRLYDPDSGTVLVDGSDLRNVDPITLRDRIGTVQQEAILFNASIMENIKYGNPKAGIDEVKEAAKQAYADEFIEKMPRKYDYIVGGAGVKLSGGQKQRIALARVLLEKPDILLFDEATSALDPHSEKKIKEAIEESTKGKTAVIVAHRLSTIKDVDKIMVLDKGKIVERGNYKRLMKKKGKFYRAYKQMLK